MKFSVRENIMKIRISSYNSSNEQIELANSNLELELLLGLGIGLDFFTLSIHSKGVFRGTCGLNVLHPLLLPPAHSPLHSSLPPSPYALLTIDSNRPGSARGSGLRRMRGLQSFPAACDDEISCDARTIYHALWRHTLRHLCATDTSLLFKFCSNPFTLPQNFR